MSSNPLPKHLRPRWRYLGVGIEAWPDADLDRAAFGRELRRAAANLLGDAGSAAADLAVLRFEFDRGCGQAVVRARRGQVGPARAALACIERADGHPVGVCVRGVSGTVRACEEKYIRRRPEPSERHVVFEGANRRALVRGNRLDVRVDDAFAGATDLDLERE